MAKIACEMCKSTEFLKQEGVFICQSCGLKYSAEEIKKMMSENPVVATEAVTVGNSNNYIPAVIPKRFTDEYLEEQKSIWERKIDSLEEEIEKLKDNLQDAGDKMKDCNDEIRNNLRPKLSEAKEQVAVGKHNQSTDSEHYFRWVKHAKDWQKTADNIIMVINQTEQEAEKWDRVKESTRQSIDKNRSDLTNAKAMLKDTESLLQKTPVQRMEKHYQALLDKISVSTSIDKLIELAKQFREMEGYKDTEVLGYEQLIQAKSKASSEEDFLRLAKQFREMNGYENSETLASECKELALKTHYEQLLIAKNKASNEADFIKLAKQFRDMKGYKNTSELAVECDNQSQIQREKAYNEIVTELQKLNEDLKKQIAKGFRPFSSDYKKMGEKYKVLSDKLKSFGNYKDTTNFIDICEKNSNECKLKEGKENMGCFWIIAAIVVLGIIILVVSC